MGPVNLALGAEFRERLKDLFRDLIRGPVVSGDTLMGRFFIEWGPYGEYFRYLIRKRFP